MTSYVIIIVNSMDMIVAICLVQCVELRTLKIGGIFAQFHNTLVENKQTTKCSRKAIIGTLTCTKHVSEIHISTLGNCT